MKKIILSQVFHSKKKSFLLLMAIGVAIVASSFKKDENTIVHPVINGDSVVSKKAFLAVYDVLVSPRCMNCHTAGAIPLQGEESKLHT